MTGTDVTDSDVIPVVFMEPVRVGRSSKQGEANVANLPG